MGAFQGRQLDPQPNALVYCVKWIGTYPGAADDEWRNPNDESKPK
jgi:hypothetical protein